MKKLFTLVALLACFLGAKAEWVTDYEIDYSTHTGFCFYVMGYVPEWVEGVMTDYGAMYSYKTDADMEKEDALKEGDVEVGTVTTEGGAVYHKIQLASAGWHQYFIADGIPTELDGSYKVVAMVKASAETSINVNMGWGWGEGQSTGASVKIGTEWAEVEWEYSGIGGTSCNLVAQPGGNTATIEWKWLKVTHNAKPAAPTVWQEWLTDDGNSIVPGVEHTNKYMGDAEFGGWPDWSLAIDPETNANINWRGDRTGEICAWALTMGRNFQPSVINDDSDRARPFPADIEEEPGNESNHVFAVHCTEINPVSTDDAGSVAWANQFWIQSPKAWKEGEQIKIMFRYKASKAVSAGTQIHKQHPSDYLHWQAVGDVAFTTEWQQFEKVITFDGSMATGWSLAFNLNSDEANGRTAPIDFYFDDLQWMTMKLEDGFFIAGSNSKAGLDYDFANAIPFELIDDEMGLYTATIGEIGNKESYVSEIMISTVRGNDAAFKANTLKPGSNVTTSDPDDFKDYTAASVAKIKLPMAGVWTVYLSTAYQSMSFECLEGEAIVLDNIVTNPEVLVINGVERQPTASEQPADEEAGTPAGTGNTWDNQFFIVANRVLQPNEETVVEFDYVATAEANCPSGTHAAPGAYRKNAFADFTFKTEEQHLKVDYTVPAADWGNNPITDAQSISFDLAVIKDAATYTIKNVKWYVKDDANAEGKTPENLIDATGTKNFKVKIGAGNSVVDYGTDGISTVSAKKNFGSAVIYNLAGQRVSNGFKGIVVKDGKKYVK